MNPYEVVHDFERVVADYAHAPYAVAVDSCTNALFLCLGLYTPRIVALPCRTYVGVVHAAINAGHKLRFIDYDWHGVYTIGNTDIVDSARRFRVGMYLPGTYYCLSFHWGKHLPIGRGGMILLDDGDDCELLKRMRYDGRTAGVPPSKDTFDCPGYHCLMHPDDAARGLTLMQYAPRISKDLPWDGYADLSKSEYFKNANR